MRHLSAILLAALCLLAAAPAVAGAASLVYLDGGNDVAVARPDGSLAHKVTHATDPEHGYKAISVADDGGITAFVSQGDSSGNGSFVVLDQSGSIRSGPFLFERSGICGSISPFLSAASPDGLFLAVAYFKGSNDCLGGSSTPSVRLTNRTSPTFGTSTYPSYDYLVKPHWVRHPDQRLAGIEGDTLRVWQNDAAHMEDWITVTGLELDGFDFHPTQTKLLLDLADANVTGSKPHSLALLTYTELATGSAPPTDPAPHFVCSADNYVTNDVAGGNPVWSPDGSQIAWNGPEGIFVSPAPVPSGETCLLAPKLVVPGGREVHWASFDLPEPSTGGPAGPSPTGGSATGSPKSGSAQKPSSARPSSKSSAAVLTAAKAVPGKRSFTVQVGLRQAATVRVTVTRKGSKKALGTLTYKAKKGNSQHKITSVRGKRLSPGTYKVAITVGSTTKKLTVRVLGA